MTEGNPARLILEFALPLLLGNLLQQMYNMIDAAIVGKVLGKDALAAVGASSSVQFLVLGFCIGICAGFGVPMAKYFGAGDIKKLKNVVFNAYIMTAGFAMILTAITTVMCNNIMQMMKTPDDIYNGAYSYLFIIFCGIPFSLAYNLQSGMLRAVGDSRSPFVFLAISTVLNIFLDVLFIVVFRMNVEGAAYATVIAQGVSAVACFMYIRMKSPVLRPDMSDAHICTRTMWELFYMGVPMGLQFSITAIGSMVMQAANNGLGSVYVSAFASSSKIKQLAMCPFDAVSTGVSVFASQNLGAGRIKRIGRGIFTGAMIAGTYGLLIGIVLMVFGRPLSLMFLNPEDTEVLDAAEKYLRACGIFYWSLGFLGVCRLAIQGLGYSGIAIISGVIEMFARIFVSNRYVPKYGFDAICYTDQAAWVTAAIYCMVVCAICVKLVGKKFDRARRQSEKVTE